MKNNAAMEDHWTNNPRFAEAKQEQGEPVAYIRKDQPQKAAKSTFFCEVTPESRQDRIGIYTTPQQRTWVGLTDDEMQAVVDAQPLVSNINVYFKAIEAKLKEKNI